MTPEQSKEIVSAVATAGIQRANRTIISRSDILDACPGIKFTMDDGDGVVLDELELFRLARSELRPKLPTTEVNRLFEARNALIEHIRRATVGDDLADKISNRVKATCAYQLPGLPL